MLFDRVLMQVREAGEIIDTDPPLRRHYFLFNLIPYLYGTEQKTIDYSPPTPPSSSAPWFWWARPSDEAGYYHGDWFRLNARLQADSAPLGSPLMSEDHSFCLDRFRRRQQGLPKYKPPVRLADCSAMRIRVAGEIIGLERFCEIDEKTQNAELITGWIFHNYSGQERTRLLAAFDQAQKEAEVQWPAGLAEGEPALPCRLAASLKCLWCWLDPDLRKADYSAVNFSLVLTKH